jgi:hypothetical protein
VSAPAVIGRILAVDESTDRAASVKKLYEKTGVSSRQELVARVFLDDYLPRIVRRAPLTSAGAFADT